MEKGNLEYRKEKKKEETSPYLMCVVSHSFKHFY